jgi:hypothetical protein
MKTVKEIQIYILAETGLKTSVKKGTGSMKGYINIWPKYQSNEYPNFPFEFSQKIKKILKQFDSVEKPLFCSTSEVSIYLIEDNRINFKNESKPKSKEDMKARTWGSKNSQMRLDKKAARYAKNSRLGRTGVRYW